MALDLTGISNENEFYTHHYLSAILENDLKDVFQEWRRREQEEDFRAPYAELRGLARGLFHLAEPFGARTPCRNALTHTARAA